ncbi:MAG: type IV toxin-antitoxin system AbiEi family antitoxin [Muribaculaceae bacterium]
MTLSEWIRHKEIRGQLMFSIDDLRKDFIETSNNVLLTNINRMIKTKRILAVYKGYYVIIPPQYALKGVVPPPYYIHNMMQYVGKPYYVALLSAAEMYGASHQRAMQTQVMTVPPRNKKSNKNPYICWCYRPLIQRDLLRQTNTEAGIMLYSSAELTAVDLVQYADHIGGYQRAATVLAELADEVDWNKMDSVVNITTIATLQRLGYILEFVLEDRNKSDILFNIVRQKVKVMRPLLMRNDKCALRDCNKNRWNVNMNISIEVDEL